MRAWKRGSAPKPWSAKRRTLARFCDRRRAPGVLPSSTSQTQARHGRAAIVRRAMSAIRSRAMPRPRARLAHHEVGQEQRRRAESRYHRSARTGHSPPAAPAPASAMIASKRGCGTEAIAQQPRARHRSRSAGSPSAARSRPASGRARLRPRPSAGRIAGSPTAGAAARRARPVALGEAMQQRVVLAGKAGIESPGCGVAAQHRPVHGSRRPHAAALAGDAGASRRPSPPPRAQAST